MLATSGALVVCNDASNNNDVQKNDKVVDQQT